VPWSTPKDSDQARGADELALPDLGFVCPAAEVCRDTPLVETGCAPRAVACRCRHGFPDREVKDHILVYNRFAFDESGEEEAVRLVILMATALLLAGAPAAEAAKSHRAAHWCEAESVAPLQAAVCRGWLRYCPRGYLTRCSPFRCWCVITQMNPARGDGAVAASVGPRICHAVATVRQRSATVAWSDSWPLRPAKGADI
jgi:hypothetical protein